MNKKEGYEYAVNTGIINEETAFVKLSFSLMKIKALSLGEKVVLSLIFSYINRNMDFFMSNNGIGDILAIDRSSIARIINSLKEKELIYTYNEYGKDGSGVRRYIKINRKNYNKLISR